MAASQVLAIGPRGVTYERGEHPGQVGEALPLLEVYCKDARKSPSPRLTQRRAPLPTYGNCL